MQKRLLRIYGKQVIALTGGIGSGKSFVLHCFAKLGFITIDTDNLVHKLLLPGNETQQQVAARFPDSIGKDGIIDRDKLFVLANSNPDGMTQLEEIIYPALWRYRADYIATIHKVSNRSIVVEIPLFFERTMNNDHLHYDVIVSTICAPEVQKSRAIQRNNMTIEKFNAIISRQVDNQTRIQGATLLVDTTYNKAYVFRQIESVVIDGRKRSQDSVGHRNYRAFSSEWASTD